MTTNIGRDAKPLAQTSIVKQRREKQLRHTLRRMRRIWPLYVMIIPAVLYFAIYKYAPMWGIQIAFKDYKITKGIMGSAWMDPLFHWFSYFFKTPIAMNVLSNTIILSFSKLIIGMVPPLIFALALSECRHKYFSRVVQTVSYLPHFFSWVIIYGICITMLGEGKGVINKLITSMGGQAIPFMTSNQYFRGVLVGTDLWRSIGWSSIVYLAAIMSIDTSMYEAATIDGCGRFRQMLYITLPSLGKIFVVLLITKVGHILDAGFGQVYVFMNARVSKTAEIIDTWVYTQGIGKMKYSLSTAVGLMKSVISCILVLGTNALARKWDSSLW